MVCRTNRCASCASHAGYDHGDCCEASCVDGDFVCGENGFNCLDPDYQDGYPQQSSYSYEDWCEHELDGDGNCDSDNNSEECGMSFRLYVKSFASNTRDCVVWPFTIHVVYGELLSGVLQNFESALSTLIVGRIPSAVQTIQFVRPDLCCCCYTTLLFRINGHICCKMFAFCINSYAFSEWLIPCFYVNLWSEARYLSLQVGAGRVDGRNCAGRCCLCRPHSRAPVPIAVDKVSISGLAGIMQLLSSWDSHVAYMV